MPSSKVYTFAAIAFVILATVAAHAAGWLSPVTRLARSLVYPVSRQVYAWSVTLHGETETFQSVADLEHAYLALKEAYRRSQVDAVTLALREEENAELRRQLAFFARMPLEHVGADVVGKQIEAVGNSIVINRGARDGVAAGDPVVIADGILVGKVYRVEETSAIVQLITDNQSKVAATIINRDHSIGIVEGGYEISIQMNLIPQNEIVTIGDKVITSGLEPRIPRGLLIGTVEAVKKEVYEPFQQAVVTPAAPLQTLTAVSVITRRQS